MGAAKCVLVKYTKTSEKTNEQVEQIMNKEDSRVSSRFHTQRTNRQIISCPNHHDGAAERERKEISILIHS